MNFNLQKNKYFKDLVNLFLICGITLSMLVAGAEIFSSYSYLHVYAASSPTPPIGSKTFLTVTTKVIGGKFLPSAFTVTVSGNNPSPKSFSGSSSGTSVTLDAGKYKVTASGPTGYTTTYSSGCSGIASGGIPVNCTISSTFSPPSPIT
ncbi:MAG: hypothetical protein ACTHKC_00775 [Candidatus Nitrosocosmicus sp.]